MFRCVHQPVATGVRLLFDAEQVVYGVLYIYIYIYLVVKSCQSQVKTTSRERWPLNRVGWVQPTSRTTRPPLSMALNRLRQRLHTAAHTPRSLSRTHSKDFGGECAARWIYDSVQCPWIWMLSRAKPVPPWVKSNATSQWSSTVWEIPTIMGSLILVDTQYVCTPPCVCVEPFLQCWLNAHMLNSLWMICFHGFLSSCAMSGFTSCLSDCLSSPPSVSGVCVGC